MRVMIIATIGLTILLFSFGNNKTPRHTKEDENVGNDPGSDGDE
jgi:hypothetical protein